MNISGKMKRILTSIAAVCIAIAASAQQGIVVVGDIDVDAVEAKGKEFYLKSITADDARKAVNAMLKQNNHSEVIMVGTKKQPAE